MAGDREDVGLIKSGQRSTAEKSYVTRSDQARARFYNALQILVDEKLDHASLIELPELEMLEASTQLTKQR